MLGGQLFHVPRQRRFPVDSRFIRRALDKLEAEFLTNIRDVQVRRDK